MSIHLVAKVMNELVLTPTEKSVLVTMAEVCHKDLDTFWLSERLLMYRTGHGERTVRQAIEALCLRGVITRVKPGSAVAGTAAEYQINLAAFDGCGPKWSEWDLSRADISQAQAEAAAERRRLATEAREHREQSEAGKKRRAALHCRAEAKKAPAGAAAGSAKLSTPEAGAAAPLRREPPQAPAGAADGSGGSGRPPIRTVEDRKEPSLAPSLGSGASGRSNLASLVRSLDAEEGDLEAEKRRQRAGLAAQAGAGS